jgi:hypothetical protein
MTQRILLAAFLGGLALFVWEFIAQTLTPLGQMGFKTLPDEAAVSQVIRSSVPGAGLYLFPAPKPGQTTTERVPSGMLLYRGRRAEGEITPAQLLVQFLDDVIAMLILALVVAQLSPALGFRARITAVLLISLMPALRFGIPYVNWYGFPRRMMAAAFLIDLVGYAIGGFILVRMVQGRPKTLAAAS